VRVKGKNGSALVEVLVALAIAAGPLLWILDLVNASTASARLDAERVAVRGVLLDVLEKLAGEGRQSLTRKLAPGADTPVDDLLRRRIDRLPDEVRHLYRQQIASMCESVHAGDAHVRLKARLDDDLDPGDAPALSRLTVTAQLPGRPPVAVSRILRSEAVFDPPPPLDPEQADPAASAAEAPVEEIEQGEGGMDATSEGED
jgi:hypothetical protein